MENFFFLLKSISRFILKGLAVVATALIFTVVPVQARTTVVDVVVNSPNHTTLETAVVAAGLAGALSGDGPFTLFAPTDAAFAALPAGTIPALLADPTGALAEILKYHVLLGTVKSTALSNGMTATTLLGKNITVTINSNGVFINGAKVTTADIMTDNGVVHVIDAVLTPPRVTVVDVVVNSANHTTLETAVVAAGLAGALSGDGPFTLFAPTDAAFAALPAGTIPALLADPTGALADILKYHVVAGTVKSTDLSNGMTAPTLLGKNIKVTINSNGVFINGAKVTTADIMTDNGVVHVIDAVLTPPRVTVVDVVVNSANHTTLETAVVAAGLAGALSGDGPFTLFAPTDAAFAALPAGTIPALLADPTGALADILKYHVLSGTVKSTDLSNGQTATTLLGKNIKVTINSNGVFINGAKVTTADIMTDNGVVHVIDAVLLPRTTVVDVVVNSANHTILEAAVVAAGLADALSGDGPFTLFAPTDAAFAALPAGTIPALLADPTGALADILKYHVVAGTVKSTNLSNGQTATTLLGKNITVTINANGVFINGAKVTTADIMTDNGVVHVIDAVLLPFEPATVWNIISDSPSHETLEAAIMAAGLEGALSGNGTFTVFAPTDAAFAALPAGVVEALLADPKGDLTSILLTHVLKSEYMSDDFTNNMSILTLSGKRLEIVVNSSGIFVNGIKVIVKDLKAGNGVVHVIDAVIVPPADLRIVNDSKFGKVMTDGKGRTLYFFSRDASGASACTGTCLDNWPVFQAESLILSEGLNKSDFGTIRSSNGRLQTTYKGWPLYYYAQDLKPGDINGDGKSSVWFVAKPDYTVMLVNNQLKGNNGVNYKGNYQPGEEVIQYFTDGYGHTLYTWSRDFYGVNKYTRGDFSNNANWPIYEQTDLILPSILDRSLFNVISVYGKKQLTYKGWSLYGFGADGNVRGNTKGVSVPAPGVWPVAVKDMAPAIPATVVDIIVNSASHNTLEAAVKAAGLVEALSGAGPFTVFAPTDAAFAALPAGTIEALLADPSGLLTQILTYHVVGAKALSTSLSDGMYIKTLQGKEIKVTINPNGVFINGAKVTVADIPAGNGVVHVIDAVLTIPRVTVVDVVVRSADHNTLEAAVVAAGLAEALSGDGPFTLFAPTDAAFAALPEGTIPALLADPTGALADILKYHVLAGTVKSTGLSNGMTATTLLGKDIKVTIDENGVFINNAKVTVADIMTDNGVVHVINAVILPPYTVMDVVVSSESHNTLEAAINAAGLAGALNGAGPFTLFAPTDAAFAALPEGTIPALLADPKGALADILKYHVVAGTVKSTDLSNNMTAPTLLGKNITVTINANGVFINNAKVTVADIMTDNGVVHVIDAVLLPPRVTVVDVVVNSPDHTTLEAAVVAAGLAEALSGEGPFTLFAPTDAAFAALPEGTIPALLADPKGALADILKYHVVAETVKSTDLSNNMTATTLLGKNIKVTINANGVFINNAKVTVADIMTDNGVVHVIDAVLLPPRVTVVDVVVNSPNHNTLETAVVAAGLVGALSGDGPFTLFAPTDAAFAALPEGTIPALLADPTGALADILKYHVLAGTVKSTDLSNGMTATTLLGKNIKVTINANGVFINNAKVTVADIMTDNGVVHVIDAVLLPRTTIVDVVVNSPDHNTLETAVVAAGLVDFLSGKGPFTLFAPTDAAFAALPAGTIPALLADPTGALADILKYHVVAGTVKSTDLSNGMNATTLLGKNIKVTINANGVFINNAKVTVADIMTDNGVVHVIDAVLMPPRVTIVDVVVNSPDHNTLETAVVAAGLVDVLSGKGPFTLFAPTDAAFAALPAGTIPALLADPNGALANVLKYHVVAGTVKSTNLSNGMSATTLLGENIKVTINANGVFINNAKVTVADIMTDNGVVHVIDAVLVPKVVSANTERYSDMQFRLYPNPATTNVTIELDGSSDLRGSTLSILTMDGRKISEMEMNSQRISYNTSNLQPGMYLVVLKKNDKVQTERLVVR